MRGSRAARSPIAGLRAAARQGLQGGLVSYGPDVQAMLRRAEAYVDRIFRGATPGELAIEQPDRYEMVINMRAAKALGLTIPQSVLLRADEVIQ